MNGKRRAAPAPEAQERQDVRRKDVKTIIAYYFEIPDMRKGFTAERARLESEYDGLRGTSYDGSAT